MNSLWFVLDAIPHVLHRKRVGAPYQQVLRFNLCPNTAIQCISKLMVKMFINCTSVFLVAIHRVIFGINLSSNGMEGVYKYKSRDQAQTPMKISKFGRYFIMQKNPKIHFSTLPSDIRAKNSPSEVRY